MSGLVGNPFLLASAAGGATGYQIERSLRFNSSDSAFCSRTFTSSGNRKKWTWAGWVKRSSLGSVQRIFAGWDGGTSDDNYTALLFFSDETIRVGGYSVFFRTSNAVFRDTSAWMHIVFVADLDNANNALKFRVWVNNVELSWTGAGSNPSTTGINAAVLHGLGGEASAGGGSFCNLYLADVYFIDGQALDPSSFVETSATTGQLIPKAYTGSFGTNGFWLKFSDNSAATATTLGKDYSGNSNNWTPNNLSVTAGAGNDSLVDTPTSYGTDTGAGGEVRGNYCTLNPLSLGSGVALANGNLDVTLSTSNAGALGTIAMPSGKWYFEGTVGGTGNNVFIAIRNAANTQGYFYATSGLKADFSGAVAYGASSTNGDVLGVAFDNTAGTITFYKNGVSQGVAYSGISTTDTWFPYWYSNVAVSTAWSFNFGQRPFAYTAPSGFKALCDTNLPAPVVAKSSDYFQTVLYTGNGSTQTISGLGFSPDLVWLKMRSASDRNILTDIVRGVTNTLNSDSTRDEATATEPNQVTAYTSSGFTVGSNSNVNGTGSSFVAWAWDAGSSTVTNTQGSITSSVRANASAGFSIVTYTGNLSSSGTATVGHGLNVAPQMIITKRRNGASDWVVQHAGLPSANNLIYLNSTASTSTSGFGTIVAPTSSVFTTSWITGLNTNGDTHVGYCFAPVTGYSSFGSYTGNGSADGPFVYTGFRPRWIMVKCSSTNNGYTFWDINDAARSDYNSLSRTLCANLSDAEDSANIGTPNIDILSNGFKIRTTGSAKNLSSQTYIYAAFAENPFQYARAR